jgi:arsenate reductase-like glutaredoxin family protein
MKNLVAVLAIVGLGYLGYQMFFSGGESKVEALYEMPYVVVYGRTTCSWTQKCLRELKEQNIDVIFENIDKLDIQQEIFPRIDAAGHNRNRISIPIVDVNGNILIGYEPEKILKYYRKY